MSNYMDVSIVVEGDRLYALEAMTKEIKAL